MVTNIFMGIGLHAVGGIAAAACYLPQKGTPNWSYQSYWLLFCFSGWFLMPIFVAILTVPNLMQVLVEVPAGAMVNTTFLGAIYGFGGMAFALAIRYIGFSLTYSIAIGISAVLGTIVPAVLAGNLVDSFAKPGGSFVLLGFIISISGVGLCGVAGTLKEKELGKTEHENPGGFNARKGLPLVIFAGILSSVFGLSLEAGNSMDIVAASHGAGDFQSNVKYIFAMGGAFLTNLIWWGAVHIKRRTLREYIYIKSDSAGMGALGIHYIFAILSGVLWYGQFFFYGLGHVHMGDYQFISWGIHMSMLIFFSFGIGFILREWTGLEKKTMWVLYVGLSALLISFGIITYGSWAGG